MTDQSSKGFPKVLAVAMGRINAADANNNGLLLRNLFAEFPRKNLAQIFSGGDNGDEGFFGKYYQLQSKDRRIGRLFFKLKGLTQNTSNNAFRNSGTEQPAKKNLKSLAMKSGRKLLMDTGYYEIIFRPRLSNTILQFVDEFKPDIIFAQGYNLAFTWLPLMLSRRKHIPVVYYPTDDWSNARYIPETGCHGLLPKITKHVIRSTVRKLVKSASVRIVFNQYMKEVYQERFGVDQVVLMQGDTRSRYDSIEPVRLVDNEVNWIVCTGDFDRHRLPLLCDLDEACETMQKNGINVKATVFPVNDLEELQEHIDSLKHIQFEPCPSHNGLVSYLKGADILFLPERFDETVSLIRLSVSSKAHLFMFSGKPIVVYSDIITGIARYAREEGWAKVVSERDPKQLEKVFQEIIENKDIQKDLIQTANSISLKNHDLHQIQNKFKILLQNVTQNNQKQ